MPDDAEYLFLIIDLYTNFMRGRQRSKGRNIQGILLLDKPMGITSNEALQRVKSLFKARKAGHTGSLDKMATGLLPLCFGEATKFSGYLLNADKHYLATCKLGVETTTGDALGDIISEKPVPDFSRQQLENVLKKFRGNIEQIPPMFSALKHKGQRLYKLAYQGIEVERQARPLTIHQLQLIKFDGQTFEIDVRCSKGTYIRTLAEDIGKQLGCGAHVIALRRVGAGPYVQDEMISMTEIEELAKQGLAALDEKLLSIDTALRHLPHVELNQDVADYLYDGQAVIVPHAPTSGMLRVYNEQDDFLGVAEILDDGRVAPRRLLRS